MLLSQHQRALAFARVCAAVRLAIPGKSVDVMKVHNEWCTRKQLADSAYLWQPRPQGLGIGGSQITAFLVLQGATQPRLQITQGVGSQV